METESDSGQVMLISNEGLVSWSIFYSFEINWRTKRLKHFVSRVRLVAFKLAEHFVSRLALIPSSCLSFLFAIRTNDHFIFKLAGYFCLMVNGLRLANLGVSLSCLIWEGSSSQHLKFLIFALMIFNYNIVGYFL